MGILAMEVSEIIARIFQDVFTHPGPKAAVLQPWLTISRSLQETPTTRQKFLSSHVGETTIAVKYPYFTDHEQLGYALPTLVKTHIM